MANALGPPRHNRLGGRLERAQPCSQEAGPDSSELEAMAVSKHKRHLSWSRASLDGPLAARRSSSGVPTREKARRKVSFWPSTPSPCRRPVTSCCAWSAPFAPTDALCPAAPFPPQRPARGASLHRRGSHRYTAGPNCNSLLPKQLVRREKYLFEVNKTQLPSPE